MRDHLVIYINGQRHGVRGEDAFLSLTDFLRERLRLTGTKVVCAEGDCGSCTILLGQMVDGELRYAPVCGCIQRLFQLDGCHVVTVEGLKYEGELNPVQQAMAACHGAQCGYCTPGFVVSMHAMLEPSYSLSPRERARVRGPSNEVDLNLDRRQLTGNLCRCTGYLSILESVQKCDTARLRSAQSLYPDATMRDELATLAREPLEIAEGKRRFFKPVTIEQALQFRARHPGAMIIAGGTDIGVIMNKKRFDPPIVMSTAAIESLRSIEVRDDRLVIGGGVTLTALQQALVVQIKEFGDYLEWFGSPLIRNAGTLAGNLVTGSPIGDTLPPLYALDASIELTGPGGTRLVNIFDFYTGYRQSVLKPDELLTRVIIPLPRPDEIFRLFKVSKRKDLDISTFSAAIWMRLKDGQVIDTRIAMGGVGPVVLRLKKTEAFLRGKHFDAQTLGDARLIVLSEIAPISDVRSSAEYRNLVAGNILHRLHAEMSTSGNGNGHEVTA